MNKAIDGDVDTYWWSDNNNTEYSTFTVTLAETKAINAVIVSTGERYMKTFDLQVSEDNLSYQTIGQYETTADDTLFIGFDSINAKYVRFENITAEPGQWNTIAGINEIEIEIKKLARIFAFS